MSKYELNSRSQLQSEGNCRWRSTGPDPYFELVDSDGQLVFLKGGWYWLNIALRTDDETVDLQPKLYVDYGNGYTEASSFTLSHIRTGKGLAGVICFTSDVQSIRFDPLQAEGDFAVDGVDLRCLGKVRAALHLLRSLVLRDDANWNMFGQVIVKLWQARSNMRQLGIWLYGQYCGTCAPVVDTYETWVRLYDAYTSEQLKESADKAKANSEKLLISVIMPVYNTPKHLLIRCIESVRCQTYPNWQLCVADDASTSATVIKVLRKFENVDKRIRVVQRTENGHISATTNSALALADGQYVALLDHDDELHPMALYEIAKSLRNNPDWKLIYSDEDKIDLQGRRFDPYMKPDWNYELFLSQNCISHLGVFERQLVNEVGGFREGYEGSQDWDLALRCIERLAKNEIGHISRVLYHWRAIPGSTAVGVGEKGYAREAARRALNEHLDRMQPGATVEEIYDRPGNFRVRFPLREIVPKVSVVIPTRDGLHLLTQCVNSILYRSTYKNYEIVIVDNQSVEPTTLQYLDRVSKDPKVRVITYDHPFNYSALNNYAVARTDGDVIALLNNDIEVISPDWIEEMVSHVLRPDVGVVGAMLYYPNDTIQHAGVVLGIHGVAAHAYCGAPRGHAGQMGRARLTQEMSAVTAACLLVRRSVFEEVSGLDESLKVAFNDVDFCLRVRAAGYRNIWTPFAELYHHESATRGSEDSPEKKERFHSEVEIMISRWGALLESDPAYNRNLTRSGTPFDLAFPPSKIDGSMPAAGVKG